MAAAPSDTMTDVAVAPPLAPQPGVFGEDDQSLSEALQFRKQLLDRSCAPAVVLSDERVSSPPHARAHTEPFCTESAPTLDRPARSRVFSVDEMVDGRSAGPHPHPPMLVRPVATRPSSRRPATASAGDADATAPQDQTSLMAHALEMLMKRSSLPPSRSPWSQEASSCSSSWSFGTPPMSRPPSLTPSTSHDERELYSPNSSPNSLRSLESLDSDIESLHLATPVRTQQRPRAMSQQQVRKFYIFDHPRVPGLSIREESTTTIEEGAQPVAFVAQIPPQSRGWKALLVRDEATSSASASTSSEEVIAPANYELRRSPGSTYALVRGSASHDDFLASRRIDGVKEWTFPKLTCGDTDEEVSTSEQSLRNFVWRRTDAQSLGATKVVLQLFSPTKALVATYSAVSKESSLRGSLQIIPAPVQLVSDVVAPLQARDLLDKARQEAAPPPPEIIVLTLLGVLHSIGSRPRSPKRQDTAKITDFTRAADEASLSSTQSQVISKPMPPPASVIFPAFNAKLPRTPMSDRPPRDSATMSTVPHHMRERVDSDLSHLSEPTLQRAVERSPSKASRRATCVAGARPPGPIRLRPRSRVPSVCDAFTGAAGMTMPAPPSPSYSQADPFVTSAAMYRSISTETADTSASTDAAAASFHSAATDNSAPSSPVVAATTLSDAECVREEWRLRQRQEVRA